VKNQVANSSRKEDCLKSAVFPAITMALHASASLLRFRALSKAKSNPAIARHIDCICPRMLLARANHLRSRFPGIPSSMTCTKRRSLQASRTDHNKGCLRLIHDPILVQVYSFSFACQVRIIWKIEGVRYECH
jgi:hypothetical protein